MKYLLKLGLLALLLAGNLACTDQAPVPMSRELSDKATALIRKANDALDDDRLGEAQAAANQLQKMGDKLGYLEIKARIHTSKEEHQEALTTIETALNLQDDNRTLKVQKGNILSDMSRFPEAQKAYDQARAIPADDTFDVDINEAIMLSRWGKTQEALDISNALLNKCQDERILGFAQRLKVRALIQTDQISELQSIFTKVDTERASELWTVAAGAFHSEKNQKASTDAALCALKLDRKNSNALWFIREHSMKKSPRAKTWKLLVDVERAQMKGFVSYQVVSETPQEAMLLIKAIEPDNLKILGVHESEASEESSEQPMGVYSRSGIIFYDENT